jgi:hypothetical protein
MSICQRAWLLGVAGALVVVAVTAAPARAQFVEPDVSRARVRIGPVLLNPMVEVKDFGIDTNVFNESVDQAKRDFTFTLSPQTELWMRIGRTWMTGNVREDLVWYQTYATERAGNTHYTLSWLVPLNRINVSASTSFLSGRDRPGFEIDARAKRRELTMRGAAEVRVLSRTYLGVRANQETVDFDSADAFLGVNLRHELNRTITASLVTLRHQLTPLTSISVDAGRSHDRFEFSTARDADSTTASIEVVFDPNALIRGNARFGYRDYQPLASDLTKYRGTTAAVDLTYVLLGTTRFGVKAVRDIGYSYDVAEPYYLQTGVQTELAQQIFGPVDAIGRIGVENLGYRDRDGLTTLMVNRTDVVHSYGGGIGYHVGDSLRIGINVDRQRRHSELRYREYDDIKLGASITYGF